MKKIMHRVKPNSYAWLKYAELLYFLIFTVFICIYVKNKNMFALSGSITMLFIGVIFIVISRLWSSCHRYHRADKDFPEPDFPAIKILLVFFGNTISTGFLI